MDYDQMMIGQPGFTGVNYLGVQYGVRNGRRQRSFFCRHIPARVLRWCSIADILRSRCVKCKDVSRAVGVILWHKIIEQRPLCECSDVLRLSRLASAQAFRIGWTSILELDEAQYGILLEKLDGVLQNQWCSGTVISASCDVVIFTDASDQGVGCVVCSRDGVVVYSLLSQDTPEHLRDTHIFVRELYAAIHFVEILLETCVRGTRILLGVDNSAVFFALSHFYSSNDIACAWLHRLHEKLVRGHCFIVVFQVASLHNAPSRKKIFDATILELGLKAMENVLVGQIWRIEETETCNHFGVVRHGDDDFDFDECGFISHEVPAVVDAHQVLTQPGAIHRP